MGAIRLPQSVTVSKTPHHRCVMPKEHRSNLSKNVLFIKRCFMLNKSTHHSPIPLINRLWVETFSLFLFKHPLANITHHLPISVSSFIHLVSFFSFFLYMFLLKLMPFFTLTVILGFFFFGLLHFHYFSDGIPLIYKSESVILSLHFPKKPSVVYWIVHLAKLGQCTPCPHRPDLHADKTSQSGTPVVTDVLVSHDIIRGDPESRILEFGRKEMGVNTIIWKWHRGRRCHSVQSLEALI